MTPDRKEKIRDIIDLAEFIFEENQVQGRVDPKSILKNEGVRVCFGNYKESFDGLLEWRNRKFYAYCNLIEPESEQAPRARFTLAHEAGHYFIDDHRNALSSGRSPAHPSFCDFRSALEVEREADIFATYLLIPRKNLIKKARKYEKGFIAIHKLSDYFGTSITSTALRYIDDVLGDGALIYWNLDGSRRWQRISKDWWHELPKKTIDSFDKLVSGSVTEKVINSGNLTGEKYLKQGTTASAWFPRIKVGWSNDSILLEEAISLGQYGYLTLLYPDTGVNLSLRDF